jgi:hypothetical protein
VTLTKGVTQRLTNVQRQKRQITIDALLDASRPGMIEYGLDISVDHIATLGSSGCGSK